MLEKSKKHYEVLDTLNKNVVAYVGTTEEICAAFGIEQSVFHNFKSRCNLLADRYLIKNSEEVSKPEEEWRLIKETKDTLIYVSNAGNIKSKDKKTRSKKEVILFETGEKHELCVEICGYNYKVKNLVASMHTRGYKNGCHVTCIDGNERNCSVENLRISFS